MKLKPVLDRVIVKPSDTPEKSTGGIVIPASSDKHKRFGKVVATSEGVPTADGDLRNVCVKKGDQVVYDPADAIEIKDGDVVLNIILENAVLAILK